MLLQPGVCADRLQRERVRGRRRSYALSGWLTPCRNQTMIPMTMDIWVPVLSDDEIKREREKARELRQSQWWKRRRSAGICQYCGKKFPPHALTMDHLVPLIRGGRSTKGNLVPACKECNAKKKHQLAFESELDEQSALGRQPSGIDKKAGP